MQRMSNGMKNMRAMLLMLFAAISLSISAQTITLTGNAKDNIGEAVIGASVIEKGNTGNGTITDLDGNFTLKPTSVVTIENNTFYNVSNNSGKRILYIRLKGNNQIRFNKNILAATAGYYSNQTSTKIVEMVDNNYFNTPNFTASAVDKAINDKGSYTTADPGFKDAANGDFTISNEMLKDNNIGDPRWLK